MESIGKYLIQEVIGRGGMGTVYRARDPVIGRDVAIKVIAEHVAAIPNVKDRFQQEAVSAGRLTHEYIMTIFDVGENEGRPFLVMELLDGRDLRNIFESGDVLPFDRKLEIALQICRGLAYAHANGVVHRDIKPENVRILSNGRLKILDFGIARVESETRTMTHSSIGTPRYMSPELVREQKIDHRTDIFSFGVLLYELLSGVNPFDGSHVTAVIYKILHEEPEPVKVDDARLSADLQRIVARCLEKDVDKRYPDFESVIHDLETVVSKRQSGWSTLIDERVAIDESELEGQPFDARGTGAGRGDTKKPSTLGKSEREENDSIQIQRGATDPERKRKPAWLAAAGVAVLVAILAGGYVALQHSFDRNSERATVLTEIADSTVAGYLDELRQDALQLRDEMRAEKRNAEQWSESEDLAPLYSEAMENELIGISALQEETDSSYQRAADAFLAAKNAFHAVAVAGERNEIASRDEVERSRQELADARQAEAVEAARQRAETAREDMEDLRIGVAQWREVPENVTAYQRGENLRQEGLDLAGAARYEDALTYFERAATFYTRVHEPEEPPSTGGLETADEARAEMEESKSRVPEIHQSHERYEEAAQIERRALADYADLEYDSAADLFGQAAEIYGEVADIPPPKTAEEAVRETIVPMLARFKNGLEQEDVEELRGMHEFLGAYSAMFDVAEDIRADISHSNIAVSGSRATVDVIVDLSYRNRTHEMRLENQNIHLLWTLEEGAEERWRLSDIERQ